MLFARFQTSHDKKQFYYAVDFAERAYAANPTSSKAVFARARAAYFAENCDEGARVGGSAAALNPFDPVIAEALGTYLAACDVADSATYLRAAIALDPEHTTLARVALAFSVSRSGNPQEALELLRGVTPTSRQQPQVDLVTALALARLGRQAEAQRLWLGIAARYGVTDVSQPRTLLQHFISSDRVIMAVEPEAKKYLSLPLGH